VKSLDDLNELLSDLSYQTELFEMRVELEDFSYFGAMELLKQLPKSLKIIVINYEYKSDSGEENIDEMVI
jgi:hypothetical protein